MPTRRCGQKANRKYPSKNRRNTVICQWQRPAVIERERERGEAMYIGVGTILLILLIVVLVAWVF